MTCTGQLIAECHRFTLIVIISLPRGCCDIIESGTWDLAVSVSVAATATIDVVLLVIALTVIVAVC